MTEKSLSNAERCAIFDENFSFIQKEIKDALKKAGRKENDCRLLAATKTVPVEVINHAIEKGLDLIGENKVQELKEKFPFLNPRAEVHFIGHLQTNKVKDVVPMVSMIHSVSSLHLAEEIDKQCRKQGKVMDVLLEINIGNEESKSGFSAEEVLTVLPQIAALSNVRVRGLMAIPPAEGDVRKYFCKMFQLFLDIEAKKVDNISMVNLSMGMSQDYPDAIACGANIVRIGSSLFGQRNYGIK